MQSRISAGVFPKQALIWAAGLEQWQNLSTWQGELNQMSEQQSRDATDPTPGTTPSAAKAKAPCHARN